MEIGIKLWPDRLNMVRELSEFADFIEIMAAPDLKSASFAGFSVPFTVHAQHNGFNVNPSDSTKRILNLKAVSKAKEIADTVKSDIIILHPGIIDNKNCSVDTAIKFFREIDDSRIVVENLCDNSSLCHTPEDLKIFKQETGADFCFDFAHAVIAAHRLKEDYKEIISRFMKLKPVYFHLSDGLAGSGKDHHWNLGKGDYDLKFMASLIKNKRVALEIEINNPQIYKEQVGLARQYA